MITKTSKNNRHSHCECLLFSSIPQMKRNKSKAYSYNLIPCNFLAKSRQKHLKILNILHSLSYKRSVLTNRIAGKLMNIYNKLNRTHLQA